MNFSICKENYIVLEYTYFFHETKMYLPLYLYSSTAQLSYDSLYVNNTKQYTQCDH